MSYKIDTSKSPLHYLKHLMGLDINKIDKLFTPLFDKRIENTETSEFLDSLDDEISDLMFSMDKSELSEQALLSFNSSILSNYLLSVQLRRTTYQHNENLKENTSSLKSAVVIIEHLLQHQNDSIDNDKSVAKAYFALKEEIKTLEDKQVTRSRMYSDAGKKGNSTPPNTVEYFYMCVDSVLALDTEKQLYKVDIVNLARRLLLDRDELYKIDWGNKDPFKDDFFKNKINEYPKLPAYLKTSKGKQPKLKPELIRRIETELDLSPSPLC
jgi:hypothetical protein